ncbi:hypothetical protein, partial [Oceaniglobus roseus]|uniref:hypothetical protein n=1 Tax=Oceaniglobus roseus TaxID=1737570 RepID=UPI0012FFE2B8
MGRRQIMRAGVARVAASPRGRTVALILRQATPLVAAALLVAAFLDRAEAPALADLAGAARAMHPLQWLAALALCLLSYI